MTAAIGCVVSPEENSFEEIPPVRGSAGGAQINQVAPNPAAASDSVPSTATPPHTSSSSLPIAENPGQPLRSDDFQNSEGTYPRSVPLEELTDLCRTSGTRVGGRSRGIEQKYWEYDGSFELENELYLELDVSANDDRHLVIKDENGLTLNESFIVDEIEYTLDGEGKWQASAVGEWLTTSQNAQPGSGADSGVGTEGRVNGTEQTYRSFCGLPVDWFTNATDHGIVELDGVSVRHVSLHAESSPQSWIDGPSTHEWWVDAQGRKVQSLHTFITSLAVEAPGGQPTREKTITLWNYTRGAPDVIVAPKVNTYGR